MYAKLTFRNAKRSAGDYLLYITTLIVLSGIMMFSNLLSCASNQKGLQATSIPLLVSMVMVALLSYINSYMLRQRAKEFGTYVLLGMKKGTIALMYFGESFIIGILSLIIGIVLCIVLFLIIIPYLSALFLIPNIELSIFPIAIRDTLFYFIAIQVFSLFVSVRRIKNMQIKDLISDGYVNQKLKSKPRPIFWSVICIISLICDFIFISFITGSNDILMMLGTNIIIFSLVIGIWAFYKAAFHWLTWIRKEKRHELYKGNRLYLASQLLAKITSNILLNTVLSTCLLFSIITFSVGFIMPNIPGNLFDKDIGIWMSFAEICLCVIFISVYFSILAVRQIIEVKENRHAFRIMAYLGRDSRERNILIKKEIVLKYSFPIAMCILTVLICAFPINSFLNTFLLVNNVLFVSVGLFGGCFLLMYICYTFVAYRLCLKQI